MRGFFISGTAFPVFPVSTLILCATARLAQSLRAVPPAGAGATWRTPWTATPGQWFGELAEILLLEGVELPQALDGEAERLLWERIVRNRLDEDSAPLFDVEGMAASAQDAHALLRAWCLDLPRQAFASDEVKLFIDWRERFQRRCQTAGWLDAAGLQCTGSLQSGVGVGRGAPVHVHAMLAGLQQIGAGVVRHAPDHAQPVVRKRPLESRFHTRHHGIRVGGQHGDVAARRGMQPRRPGGQRQRGAATQ